MSFVCFGKTPGTLDYVLRRTQQQNPDTSTVPNLDVVNTFTHTGICDNKTRHLIARGLCCFSRTLCTLGRSPPPVNRNDYFLCFQKICISLAVKVYILKYTYLLGNICASSRSFEKSKIIKISIIGGLDTYIDANKIYLVFLFPPLVIFLHAIFSEGCYSSAEAHAAHCRVAII